MEFKEFLSLTENDNGFGILPDIGLPTVSKSAKIQFINDKINPILVFLADGTQLFLPVDAFRRIKDEPKVGKIMNITFERRADDNSKFPSKVNSITVV